jgi:hypothetical protein
VNVSGGGNNMPPPGVRAEKDGHTFSQPAKFQKFGLQSSFDTST